MLPSFSSHYLGNIRLGDFKFFGQASLRVFSFGVKSANIFNVCSCKLIRFAFLFTRHIPHIVSMRAKKQMGGINATRIVAFMTNFHADRNFAEMNYPRKPVRIGSITIISGCDSQLAISSGSSTRYPDPTRFCFFNFSPKSFFKSHTEAYNVNKLCS